MSNGAKEELMKFITDLADGVIGAANVLAQMFQLGAQPQHFNALKDFNLKGSRLWLMYKDVCLQDIPMLLAFLEACHVGDVDEEEFRPYMDQLMVNRDEEVARKMRESFVHPAVRKFIAQHLEAGGDIG